MGFSSQRAGVVPISLVVAAVLLAGCGSGGDGGGSDSAATAGGQAARAVTIQDYKFEPDNISVPVGTTVTFTNQDSTPHTATSKQAGSFETGSIKPGKSGVVKFEQAGSFAYYCAFHPFMKGTITVE